MKKEAAKALPEGESAAIGPPCRGRGAVAQMGERCNRTAEVRGSIPLSSTSPKHSQSGGLTSMGLASEASGPAFLPIQMIRTMDHGAAEPALDCNGGGDDG